MKNCLCACSVIVSVLFLAIGCKPSVPDNTIRLVHAIDSNASYSHIKKMAEDVARSGFNAGDGYGEVWIRDYNTFIELSAEVTEKEVLKENLLVFFKLQGADGNIVDGFIPVDKASAGYTYIYSNLEPRYAGHKNTVETDQESSLVQAVYKYIQATGDSAILTVKVGDKTVAERMQMSLAFLLKERFDKTHGLLFGATTADWGDVQPEHDWGVYFTPETHYAIDVYDNAMFLIALDNLIALSQGKSGNWLSVRDSIRENVRTHLWDSKRQKFRPHIYLNGSPFPETFDEDSIYYHGGTAIAIEAGLLSREEIKYALNRMLENVRLSGAATIGLTVYPPYPQGYFKNKGMYPYGYQNGGDWDWFGGRMVQQLVKHGYIEEAIATLQPMLDRAQKNNGFYEWYTVANKPEGSGTFRGSAGVLHKAITQLQNWAEQQKR